MKRQILTCLDTRKNRPYRRTAVLEEPTLPFVKQLFIKIARKKLVLCDIHPQDESFPYIVFHYIRKQNMGLNVVSNALSILHIY